LFITRDKSNKNIQKKNTSKILSFSININIHRNDCFLIQEVWLMPSKRHFYFFGYFLINFCLTKIDIKKTEDFLRFLFKA
tara:strand:+ start:2318 stop:2557 length:240 start_codon:yes stop_codon:yes gene_type:complete